MSRVFDMRVNYKVNYYTISQMFLSIFFIINIFVVEICVNINTYIDYNQIKVINSKGH
jgi:hypothetical protein